jgi:hypothetical protein
MFCPGARLAHYHAPGGRVSADIAAEDVDFGRDRDTGRDVGL